MVMNAMRKLADRQKTLVSSIHQPNSQVFAAFDSLLLLKDGEVFYRGPTATVVEYFARLGFECPSTHNPPVGALYQQTTTRKSQNAEMLKCRMPSNKQPSIQFEKT